MRRSPVRLFVRTSIARIATHSNLPVIGVPLDSGKGLGGIDALLSTAQMPPSVPVATMTIGKAGAKNAAVFALKIMALNDAYLAQKLQKFRNEQEKKVLEKDILTKQAS